MRANHDNRMQLLLRIECRGPASTKEFVTAATIELEALYYRTEEITETKLGHSDLRRQAGQPNETTPQLIQRSPKALSRLWALLTGPSENPLFLGRG